MTDENPTNDPEPTELQQTEDQPAVAPPAERGRSWRTALSARGWLIGSAVALVLVSGLGGFAIGHATAGDGDGHRLGRMGFPQDGQSRPDFNRDGNGPPGGPGFVPPGRDDQGAAPGGDDSRSG